MSYFCRNLDRGIRDMLYYNSCSFRIRLFLDMSVEEHKCSMCERWSDINSLCLDLFITHYDKEFVLDRDDDEIQCMF